MHRNQLRDLLNNYNPYDPHEKTTKQKMLQFLAQYPDCFSRSCAPGHFTASSWLVNHNFDQALLTHHAKLNAWLQLGGHADGATDLLAVALKEAHEESGLPNIVPIFNEIFDIDLHVIPARKDEPQHLHYDVRFLLRTTTDCELVISTESNDLGWFLPAKIKQIPDVQQSIIRMCNKWQSIII